MNKGLRSPAHQWVRTHLVVVRLARMETDLLISFTSPVEEREGRKLEERRGRRKKSRREGEEPRKHYGVIGEEEAVISVMRVVGGEGEGEGKGKDKDWVVGPTRRTMRTTAVATGCVGGVGTAESRRA